VSIYLVAGIVYDFVGELRKEKCVGNTIFQCKAKWPIYLTNWNFLVLTLQALMATFLVTRHVLRPDNSGLYLFYKFLYIKCFKRVFTGKMQSSHKIYWILNNISNGLSPLVSIMYWGVVHNPGNFSLYFIKIILMSFIAYVICWFFARFCYFYIKT